MNYKYLLTGSSSGLGKFLKEELPSLSYNRSGVNYNEIYKNKNQIIIHSAFNTNNQIYIEDLDRYIDDNINLTKKILKLPNKRIIFISSIDVYPEQNSNNSEDDKINIYQTKNLYALSKLICEDLIQKHSIKPIILRLGYLVGSYMKNSNVKKAIVGGKQKITISSESNYNIVTYNQVLSVIRFLLFSNKKGIYNLCSNNSVKLSEICKYYNTKADFGNFQYKSPIVSTNKIISLGENFGLDISKENLIRSLVNNI